MRKNANAYVFGILFIVVVCVLGLNNFNVKVLLGKTEEIKGKITNIKVRPVRGGYVQYVEYTFKVDTSEYLGSTTVGKQNGPQYIGNSIGIRYLVSNPEKNKPTVFYKRPGVDTNPARENSTNER